MSITRLLRIAWIVGVATLAPACVSTPSGAEPPEGTLVLGEVMRVLTRQMVDANELAPGDERPDLASKLREWGYTDEQIDAGRIVVQRGQIYWNNSMSGIKRSWLLPALVPQGLAVEPGNVIEIELVGRPAFVVRKVRATDLARGGCYYDDVPVGVADVVLGTLTLLGPRGVASLYCEGIEKEDWQRPGSYWYKPPGAQALAAGALREAPPVPSQTGPAPARAAIPGDLAVVTVKLTPRYVARPYFYPLAIWIDDKKAAELDHGTCEVVLVPAGEHVVVAGSDDKNFLRTHARRELVVSVSAGDKLVLEYRVDNDALVASEQVFEMFQREKWSSQIYHFTQRSAGSQDTCAIRHAPIVLRGGAPAAAGKAP